MFQKSNNVATHIFTYLLMMLLKNLILLYIIMLLHYYYLHYYIYGSPLANITEYHDKICVHFFNHHLKTLFHVT